jgi:coenzyme F420-reducing hydrogenase delta subunit
MEEKYGQVLRLFPLPCSGRVETLHFLKALEEVADVAYLIACPEGACRYFEGNGRAKKRVERARTVIASIGLEKERVGIVINSREDRKTLAQLTEEIMARIAELPPSAALARSVNG